MEELIISLKTSPEVINDFNHFMRNLDLLSDIF
jgi:hypothetical protein